MIRTLCTAAVVVSLTLALTPPKPPGGEDGPRASHLAPRASLLAPRAPGAIRGRVDVRAGGAPELRPDPGGLGMAGGRDPVDRRRSVVYLEIAPRAAFEVSEGVRARMDQKNERFVPHVLAIVAGTWVDFPNDDRTYHNVFSLSKTKEFNLGRYAVGHYKSVRFERPGIVRVFCDIHSHMSGFILVFAHRFFAVTDDEGRYRLDGVPPGTYTVAVWNETVHGDAPRRVVTIPEAGGDADADFSIR
jgi:plastocyanin